ncbi:extracellular solute-binding protein [Anaerocolumna sedimenticola]|uniref:Extracellular solute-binding protein n=1 Tax=Anaerocolumna sedimenticola TaxID=2696063 RepID=A0A6P1TLL1_9FIRM|nr:extracellular solute-binding protein [Anaerocolumna sedimenticola]QHQ60901.1 extracellular solute-binding protein [Anaerocolumna sedimenticola]
MNRKNSLSKLLSLLMVLVFVISLSSGCSGNKKVNSDNTGAESADTSSGGEASERPKVTILTNINVDTEGSDVNDNDYVKYIEDQTGIDIEFINDTSSVYTQKLNTIMASNDLPDAVMLMGDTQRSDLARFAEEKMLIPLDDYIDSYPNLKANIKQESWDVTKYDGNIYAVPFQRYDSSPYMTFLNKSWLEALGINPETDLVTVDDWYNMLKRFVTDDPDKNGQEDTFGITATSSGTHFTNFTFLDSFGAAKAKYVNGELLPNYILPEYKEWLIFMNKLYEEKILDTNFIVDDPSTIWDKINSGKAGAFLWFWGLTEYQSMGYDRSKLVAVKPPVHKDGSEASYVYSSPNRHMMAITSACEHPEYLLKLWDWACSEEGGIFTFAGLEGKDYDLDSSGSIVLRDDRKGKNIGWRQLTLGVQLPNVDKEPIYGIMTQNFGEQGIHDLMLSNEYGSYDDLSLYCPVFNELLKYDFTKSVQEFTDKAITGAIDIEAEWDNYVANWRKEGGDEKIKLSTDWYVNSDYYTGE